MDAATLRVGIRFVLYDKENNVSLLNSVTTLL